MSDAMLAYAHHMSFAAVAACLRLECRRRFKINATGLLRRLVTAGLSLLAGVPLLGASMARGSGHRRTSLR